VQLLSAGIVDRKSGNRYTVIKSLEGPLEPYLAKVEALRTLFVFLYDDDPATRRLAVSRVGRLSDRNPAYVMPALSRLLAQLLNDLSVYTGTPGETGSMETLTELVRTAPRVVRPYVHTVIDAVMTKLSDPSSDVFSAALVCAGELARVDDGAIAVQMPKLVGLILDVLQDQSSVKRKEAAVKVLGQLAQQTGEVIGMCVVPPSVQSCTCPFPSTFSTHNVNAHKLKVQVVPCKRQHCTTHSHPFGGVVTVAA
jgi:FKBP12-rapamycin complex-associated protein